MECGSSGMDGSKYICTYAFERVIDPDQVAAVLNPEKSGGISRRAGYRLLSGCHTVG